MKRAAYDLGHFTLRFLVVAFILTLYIMTYRTYEGKNLLQTYNEKTQFEDLLFFDRLSRNCFSPSSLDSMRKDTTTFDISLSTRERLASCIPLQSRLTLAPLVDGEKYSITSADVPSFRPDASQETIVLVDGMPYVLKMEIQHA